MRWALLSMVMTTAAEAGATHARATNRNNADATDLIFIDFNPLPAIHVPGAMIATPTEMQSLGTASAHWHESTSW